MKSLQRLQKSANSSDAQSKPEFRRRTTQSFLAISKQYPFNVGQTCDHIGRAARPYEECDEKLQDMIILLSIISSSCCIFRICILLSPYSVSQCCDCPGCGTLLIPRELARASMAFLVSAASDLVSLCHGDNLSIWKV